eukprot:Blabericola_migrator_1__8390@NODE_436_length_8493_cov_87_644434_g342_i0_p7_GENE_NODE_436_length_8493_cov_87_644434_g342_i0NODE_436_length_8493_cov_87_644434_g342_i0_p7_ORF_typecomplete_len116_score23_35_NODE_436_length_8493_cov_87_644434_g342_i031903537
MSISTAQKIIIDREFNAAIELSNEASTRHDAIDAFVEIIQEVLLADLNSSRSTPSTPPENEPQEISILDILKKLDSFYDQHSRTSILSRQEFIKECVKRNKCNKTLPMSEYLLVS